MSGIFWSDRRRRESAYRIKTSKIEGSFFHCPIPIEQHESNCQRHQKIGGKRGSRKDLFALYNHFHRFQGLKKKVGRGKEEHFVSHKKARKTFVLINLNLYVWLVVHKSNVRRDGEKEGRNRGGKSDVKGHNLGRRKTFFRGKKKKGDKKEFEKVLEAVNAISFLLCSTILKERRKEIPFTKTSRDWRENF